MSAVAFIALDTEEVRALQMGAADANGQKPERHISDGDGVPCRHCQRDVGKGESYLILNYRPFPALQPYAESGPIFLHAEPCERYALTQEAPDMFFKNGRRYLIKGYYANDRIAYGTGTIVEPHDMAAAAAKILERSDIAYIHVRSALNNCYQLRIERA
ncbi:MAG TPA: DUF1203 domain-containing protein [Nordella sp.]|nr:DUF1203 domain-containing protein [Nordella sp.]